MDSKWVAKSIHRLQRSPERSRAQKLNADSKVLGREAARTLKELTELGFSNVGIIVDGG